MSQIRRGVTQANYNESMSGFFMFQVFCIAVALGIYYESWWVFGGTLLGLIFGVSSSAFIGALLAIALGLGWGYVAYQVMGFFDASSGALWVVTILVSMSTMGANFAGVEWAQDVAGYDPTPSPKPQQRAARSIPRQASPPQKKKKKKKHSGQSKQASSGGGFGGFADKEKAIHEQSSSKKKAKSKPANTEKAPQKSADEIAKLDALWEERDCPRCAETIKAKAKYCRFCEYTIEDSNAYLGMRTVLEKHAKSTGVHAAELLPKVSAIEAIATQEKVDWAIAAQKWSDDNAPAAEKPKAKAKKKPAKKQTAQTKKGSSKSESAAKKAPKEDVVKKLSQKSTLYQNDLMGLSHAQLRKLAKARSMPDEVTTQMGKGDMIIAMAEDADSWG